MVRKTVVKISCWEPSTKTCSSCGQVRMMELSQRVYACECGLTIDRDLNAALNIKRAGLVLSGDVYQIDKAA
ncbi:zinc ribbon domain-containing protein [Methylobacter sp. G7]|uniref:zinc ribbon domain-containing protein n=1 Tax=Methylobacter sp. G7 TaxID=3230117 RepID=UPI003D80A356